MEALRCVPDAEVSAWKILTCLAEALPSLPSFLRVFPPSFQ
jgi:hypothetical protein